MVTIMTNIPFAISVMAIVLLIILWTTCKVNKSYKATHILNRKYRNRKFFDHIQRYNTNLSYMQFFSNKIYAIL